MFIFVCHIYLSPVFPWVLLEMTKQRFRIHTKMYEQSKKTSKSFLLSIYPDSFVCWFSGAYSVVGECWKYDPAYHSLCNSSLVSCWIGKTPALLMQGCVWTMMPIPRTKSQPRQNEQVWVLHLKQLDVLDGLLADLLSRRTMDRGCGMCLIIS